jgi:hypothetical protein
METKTKAELLDEAEQIVNRAVARGGLDGDERTKVKTLIALAVRRDHDEQVEAIEGARGSVAVGRSFGALATDALVKGATGPDGRIDAKSVRGATLSGFQALGCKAPDLTAAPAGTWQPNVVGTVPIAADRRYVWPQLQQVDAADSTSISDFRVAPVVVTGATERAIGATTPKANMSPTITAANDPLRTFALVVDGLPVQLVESMDGLRRVLETQLRDRLWQAVDAHAVARLAANAPAGNAGVGLVAQVRNAVSAMRAAGHQPNVLALDPADAAALDLFEDGSGALVFSTRSSGDASPLFGLTVVETAALTGADPLLVDSRSVGRLHVGTLRLDVDPFAGLSGDNFVTNRVDVRGELNGLCHVSDPSAVRRIGI